MSNTTQIAEKDTAGADCTRINPIRAPRARTRRVLATLVLAAAALTGCASVKPWERDQLADPLMQFPENGFDQGIREQHLEYREGAVGGTLGQSGGCGCG